MPSSLTVVSPVPVPDINSFAIQLCFVSKCEFQFQCFCYCTSYTVCTAQISACKQPTAHVLGLFIIFNIFVLWCLISELYFRTSLWFTVYSYSTRQSNTVQQQQETNSRQRQWGTGKLEVSLNLIIVMVSTGTCTTYYSTYCTRDSGSLQLGFLNPNPKCRATPIHSYSYSLTYIIPGNLVIVIYIRQPVAGIAQSLESWSYAQLVCGLLATRLARTVVYCFVMGTSWLQLQSTVPIRTGQVGTALFAKPTHISHFSSQFGYQYRTSQPGNLQIL